MNAISANDMPVRNLLWASQALPEQQREEAFLELWPQADITTLNEPLFISITNRHIVRKDQIVELLPEAITYFIDWIN